MEVNPPPKPTRRRLSQLQDITEEEEVSSGEPLTPPRHLELERQFVEGDGYGVALSWQPPSPLPPSVTGYNVYVNGELMSQVEGADQNSVIISGVPRKQVKYLLHVAVVVSCDCHMIQLAFSVSIFGQWIYMCLKINVHKNQLVSPHVRVHVHV